MKHKLLLQKLKQIKSSKHMCKQIWCTTCGGLIHEVDKKMNDDLMKLIEEVLSDISLDDYLKFGEWTNLLHHFQPFSVAAIFAREANQLDISDIRQLDLFLLRARGNKPIPQYQKLLDLGIEISITTGDESLIETVAIALSTGILSYNDFYSIAILKAKNNKNIHRVLYNNLRETVPEVRDYVGDGSSVMTCW